MFFALAAPARAETFPSRPVHLIIPYGPGGIVDFTGRVVAQKMSEILGQPVVAENRPGAGGIVGVEFVAHSDPDGYNVVLMDPAIVINPTLQKLLPYDIFKDLVTVTIVSSSPEVLVVAPQLGVKTYAELVAYGKANPGKLNYASAGVGTAPHLAAEMWKLRTGIDAVHVPYKGIGAILHRYDEQQGSVVVLQHRRRAAVHQRQPRHSAGDDRHGALPGLSRSADGGRSGAARIFGRSLARPLRACRNAGRRARKLNGAVNKALQDGELKAAFAKFGLTPRGTSLADGAAFTKSEYEKWKKVITDGHITLD